MENEVDHLVRAVQTYNSYGLIYITGCVQRSAMILFRRYQFIAIEGPHVAEETKVQVYEYAFKILISTL